MSSESEDEFQSADEGSDFEDSYPLDSQDTAPTKSVPLPMPSCLAATKEVKENVHLPEPIRDSKVESSEPVEEFDADDETEEEICDKPQTKSFDDKVTNLMSALDQLSVRVSKQLTKSTSKAEPADEEDTDEEDIHKCSMEKDQEKEREIKEEQELKMEEERKRELEKEAERRRVLEREEERKREIEREEEKKKQIEKEEERKRQQEQEEERKRELEREEKRKEELEREEERKRELEREEERKRELEREEERKRELEREEKRKKELEREEERKKELEREKLKKKEIAKEEEKKREIEKEKKRKMEEEEEMRKEKEREEERKRELEKEEEMKSESIIEQENKGGQEKNAGNTQDHPGVESQKAKPIRESKIGMKKPREKLGERMGARRLGAKIEKKPLESISSDSCVKPQDTTWSKEESQTDSAEAQQREVERKKEEKWRKQQQWEEQQKRWQQINKAEDTKEQEEDTSWGGGWGGWGTSLLTAASTFTREVGRGVGTVMETVEGTLGVPDPETLAREVAERDRELKEKIAKSEESISREKTPDGKAEADEPESEKTGVNPSNQSEDTAGNVPSYGLGGLSSLGSLVSGVSGALETASSKVLLGGLDTLEVIGRKAMTVIQEGDPGLRKKRAFLTNNKPNLSMMLQEARQRAAQEESDQRDGIQNKESGLFHRPNFDQAWENTEGPVHVEALSLVAKQCESKMSSLLQSMPPYLVDRIQKSNLIIKKTCEMDEESQLEGDFATQVTKIISQIRLPLHSQKIREAWGAIEETASLIEEKKKLDWTAVEKEVYLGLALLISQLAALTHKGSELALITPGSDPQAIANSFRELSSLVCAAMENTVDNICGTITAKASAADPDVNNTITNMYLQGASGNSCVQEGMMFLSSVLQYANTKLLAADL